MKYNSKRIWKKINKCAKELLIEAKIFKESDWCDIRKCFWVESYDGEYIELGAWDYFVELAERSTTVYSKEDLTGRVYIVSRNDNMSIIETIKQFKKVYLNG